MKNKPLQQAPDITQVESALKYRKYKARYATVLRSTFFTLVIVAALAILIATLWMPVLQIHGSTMEPTLKEGQIVVTIKSYDFDRGDLVSFYIGNKLLIKRVIAGPGELVDISEDGTVYVDGEELSEPYLPQKAFGDCDLELPFQVPEDQYFLMGDQRESSVDSRSTLVGCVSMEQIVGKIVLRVWPLNEFGFVG